MEWLSERAGVIPGPTNAVLYRMGDRALIIDPGLDRTAAERVRKACLAENLDLAARYWVSENRLLWRSVQEG